jgi:hypothetical protein
MCRDVNRDQGLNAAIIGTSGFAGDEVWLVLDSHMSNQLINPTTGKRWGPGEMQAGCEGAAMCSTGVITDCMMIIRGSRDGRHEMSILPYHVHKTERTVRWVDESRAEMGTDDPTSRFDGIVVDGINRAFATPKVKDLLAKDLDLSVRLNADKIAKAAAVTTLAQFGHEVLVS